MLIPRRLLLASVALAAAALAPPAPVAAQDHSMVIAMVTTPRGFDPDFEFIEDLKHRNFVAVRGLDDATLIGPRLLPVLAKDLQAMAPFMDYLCAALDLEF